MMTLPYKIPPWLREDRSDRPIPALFYSPTDDGCNWRNHPSTPFYSPRDDSCINWSNHPSTPFYNPNDDGINWSDHPTSSPFYSPTDDGYNWSNHPSTSFYSPRDDGRINWSNHQSSAPFYSPAGDDGCNWSNHASLTPFFSPKNDSFNWSDHSISAPFYSHKNLGSSFHKFPSASSRAPLSLVNHPDKSFMDLKGPNFDPSDDLYDSGPDNFLFPLGEWKSSPLLQSPRSTMKPRRTKTFENYLTPLPPPLMMELCFQDSSPSPRGSPMMRRFSNSPLSDDSGYCGDSRSFDSDHSPISPEGPLQFTDTPEREMSNKPGVKGMKRKADEDLHDSTPCRPTPKRKKVECSQNSGPSRSCIPPLPPLINMRAYPLVASPHINALQRDLDVIFRSIIEVLLCYNDIGSLCLSHDAIVSEMKATSGCYSQNNLANSERRQDFSGFQTRWGYIYMYTMRHAHLIFHSLKQIHLTSKIPTPLAYNNWNIPFDQGGLHTGVFLQKCRQPGGILTVCAIGGGPGSDLIGLALFLRANHFPVKVRAYVYDKCMDWEKTWKDLFAQLPPYITDYFDSVTYIPFDYLSAPLSNSQAEVIRKSDLVTIVKSLSAVATQLFQTKNANRRSNGLLEILSTVTPGCLVLYLDNKAGTPSKVFQQTLKKIPEHQYTMLYYEVSQVQLPSNGFSLASRHFMNWISYGPCFSSGTNEIVALAKKWMMEF